MRKYTRLSCFIVLEAMESWVGPGNEAKIFVEFKNLAVVLRSIYQGALLSHLRWVSLITGLEYGMK